MTEAERLRAQAERYMRLARAVSAKDVADALMGLAAKSLDLAQGLERHSIQQQQEVHQKRRLGPGMLAVWVAFLGHFNASTFSQWAKLNISGYHDVPTSLAASASIMSVMTTPVIESS